MLTVTNTAAKKLQAYLAENRIASAVRVSYKKGG